MSAFIRAATIVGVVVALPILVPLALVMGAFLVLAAWAMK